jgi:hypothetical protein
MLILVTLCVKLVGVLFGVPFSKVRSVKHWKAISRLSRKLGTAISWMRVEKRQKKKKKEGADSSLRRSLLSSSSSSEVRSKKRYPS